MLEKRVVQEEGPLSSLLRGPLNGARGALALPFSFLSRAAKQAKQVIYRPCAQKNKDRPEPNSEC